MPFTGKEDHSISLQEASKLTANYRRRAGEKAVLGGYFGREAIERILAQERCVGIRYYFAETDKGQPTVVLVGVDEKGEDLVEGFLAEVSWPCPPYCGSKNPLTA
ncbi:MAG: hypothetical protein ONB23_00655 [candidate division KSB1 bacterium]|nr:hypothetical protein [candidate division KSB1 bacterium]